MLREDGIEHVADELLARLGQTRDGIELLFEARDRPAPGAARRRGVRAGEPVIGDQGVNGDVEHLGEAGEQGDGHAALAELVEGELRLRDAQRLGELHLRQIGGGTGLGDALAEGLEVGSIGGAHGGLCGPVCEAMHEP